MTFEKKVFKVFHTRMNPSKCLSLNLDIFTNTIIGAISSIYFMLNVGLKKSFPQLLGTAKMAANAASLSQNKKLYPVFFKDSVVFMAHTVQQ